MGEKRLIINAPSGGLKFTQMKAPKKYIELKEGWTNFEEFESALHPKAKILFNQICKVHDTLGIDYDRLRELNEECSQYGLTFDYDLDGSIYDWKTEIHNS